MSFYRNMAKRTLRSFIVSSNLPADGVLAVPGVMCGGASTAKPGGGLATIGARLRTNTAEADKLFGGDQNKKISIVNIYDEVQRHGQELKAYWTLETIAEVLAKYDSDHDGLIIKSEFLAALNDMEANVEAYHGPQSPLKKKIQRAKSAHPKSKTKAPTGTSSKGKLSFMPRSPLSFVPLSPRRWPPQPQGGAHRLGASRRRRGRARAPAGREAG